VLRSIKSRDARIAANAGLTLIEEAVLGGLREALKKTPP